MGGLVSGYDIHLHAECREPGPGLWIPLPALNHGSRHVTRAAVRGWEGQREPLRNPHQNLLVSHALKREFPKREYLPTQDPETPDVAVEREGGPVVCGNQELGRHPANGEELRPVVIVISLVEVVTYAEVCDLDVVVGRYEAVASGQVSVDDSL